MAIVPCADTRPNVPYHPHLQLQALPAEAQRVPLGVQYSECIGVQCCRRRGEDGVSGQAAKVQGGRAARRNCAQPGDSERKLVWQTDAGPGLHAAAAKGTRRIWGVLNRLLHGWRPARGWWAACIVLASGSGAVPSALPHTRRRL